MQKVLLYIIVSIVTLIISIPFLWSILLSFKTTSEIFNDPGFFPKTFNLVNYESVFRAMDIGLYFKNSAIIAVSTNILQTITTFFSSYALARLSFRWKWLQDGIYFALLAGFAVPIFVLLFPLFMITQKLGIMHTHLSLILPYAAGGIAFNTLVLVGQLKSFPKELEESAVIDGAGLYRTLFRIVMPVIIPTIATVVIFSFVGVWNEFPLASVLIIKPDMVTVPLSFMLFYGFYSNDYGAMVAASLLVTIPQLIFYAIFQRYIMDGMVAGAVKG